MRISIRNMILAPAILAAAVLTTHSAMAAASVKVPFSFTVAGKQCPAGTYTVQQDRLHSLVTLSSKTTPQSFTWVLAPGDPAPTSSNVTLRFDAMGQSHALQSVQYGSLTTHKLDKNLRANEHIQTQIIPGQ